MDFKPLPDEQFFMTLEDEANALMDIGECQKALDIFKFLTKYYNNGITWSGQVKAEWALGLISEARVHIEELDEKDGVIKFMFDNLPAKHTPNIELDVSRHRQKNNETEKPTILIVDDEQDILHILQIQLEDAGYIISAISNVTDAYTLIQNNNFSLALVDLNMPIESGLNLLAYIQQERPETPVIMLTAHGSEGIAVEAMKKGAEDYLSKPFSTDDMLGKVERAIAENSIRMQKIGEQQAIKERYVQSILENQKLLEQLNALKSFPPDSIIKSIEFDEEAYQAGISILSYFSTIIRQKYPNTRAKVKIEQEGRLVRLIVETPDGGRELIEKTLEEYGLVLVGEMQPEELLPNKIDVMQLRHKLELAKIEISHTKELLDFTKQSHKKEITRLEEKVDMLTAQIAQAFKREEHARDVFDKIIETYAVNGATKSAMITLSGLLENTVAEKDKDIILELLAIIKEHNKPVFEHISAYLVSSMGGASGNLISTWLQLFFAALPR